MKNTILNERNSSLELLKIIAVLMIVLSHAVPYGDTEKIVSAIDINLATTDIQYFILGLCRNLGQIGNCIFIACSAWFLIDSSKTKIKKIAYLIGDSFTISVVMLVLFWMMGYEIHGTTVFKQFFPVTFGNNWFLTCYLLFYAIHPLLNIILKSLSQRMLLLINVIFVILYCIMSFLMSGSLFFCNGLIGFVGLYFLVAYIKNYLQKTTMSVKKNLIIFLLGFCGWIGMMLISNIVGLRYGFNCMQRWNQFLNPCFIMMTIGLFSIAQNRTFYNKGINYISSLSLLIYLIHCNQIVVDYFRFDLFNVIKDSYTYRYLLLWVMVYALISFVVSIILAIIYKSTLQKIVKKIFGGLCDVVIKIYERVEYFIMRLN